MDWNLISFITSSKNRFKLLVELKKAKKTPTELSKTCGMHISAISRCLKELKTKNLIICLTIENYRNKYYGISEKGEKLLDEITEELGSKK